MITAKPIGYGGTQWRRQPFWENDGRDGYTIHKGATVLIPPERALFDSEAVRRATSALKTIAPTVEGRSKRSDIASRASRSECQQ
jgi:hypothetical protein